MLFLLRDGQVVTAAIGKVNDTVVVNNDTFLLCRKAIKWLTNNTTTYLTGNSASGARVGGRLLKASLMVV